MGRGRRWLPAGRAAVGGVVVDGRRGRAAVGGAVVDGRGAGAAMTDRRCLSERERKVAEFLGQAGGRLVVVSAGTFGQGSRRLSAVKLVRSG